MKVIKEIEEEENNMEKAGWVRSWYIHSTRECWWWAQKNHRRTEKNLLKLNMKTFGVCPKCMNCLEGGSPIIRRRRERQWIWLVEDRGVYIWGSKALVGRMRMEVKEGLAAVSQ